MMDNHAYNLMMQMVIESKSLKRIKNSYHEDAEGCEDCQKFWDKMKADKEEHIKELQALAKNHL